MKNLKKLFILFIFFCSCKHAIGQVYSEMSAGYDTNGRLIGILSLGCIASNILEIQGEIRPSLTRSIYAHHYVGLSGGIRLLNDEENTLHVSMGAGYFHDLVSNDHKELNKSYLGTYVKGVKMINDRGGVSIGVLYLNSSAQFTAGIHYIFN